MTPFFLREGATLHAPQTWHHGLVADWWALFNHDAPEVEMYRPYLRSPLLDAGCGAGRLLVPLLAAGYDVDGCDASPDMIDRCRERAPGAHLWVSRLHELEPPRRYASIVVSGVFGLGSTREQDEQAVRRLHDALEPGGTLVMDNEEIPFRATVRGWNEPMRRRTADGVEFASSARVLAVDGDDHSVEIELRIETSDGRREQHLLTMRTWYRDEVVPLLERSGFHDVEVQPGIDENTLVYVASRHGDLQPLPRRD